MPFDIPSLFATRDLAVALGKALFPGLNFGSRRSFHGKQATWFAGGITQLHYHTDSAQRDLHPLTAGDGKPINDWCSAVGVERKGATPARKAAAGRVRGNAGRTVDPGEQLTDPVTGLVFAVANVAVATIPGTIGVDPDNFVDVDIVGVDVGSQTRLEAGTVLSFIATPVGLEGGVTLVLDLDEDGFDEEQFGSIRARFLGTFSESRSGGTAQEFSAWAKAALPAVSVAYALPLRVGGATEDSALVGRGTIDVAAFYSGTGTARSLSDADRDTVLAYLRTKAPFQVSGRGGGLRVITTVADPQRVEILITTTGIRAFAFDWEGSGIVLAYDPVTRELQFTAPLPTSMRAGHRIIPVGVVSGSGVDAQDGRQYKIEAITGADTVILEKTPPNDLAPDDELYPGGPLVDPIRLAVRGHLNGETVYAGRGRMPITASQAAPINPTGQSIIGLDVLVDGIGPANPGSVYGSWSGGILLSALTQIATYKAGVRNIEIVTPATDYQAEDDAFPLDDQIHYVTPGVTIIRGA